MPAEEFGSPLRSTMLPQSIDIGTNSSDKVAGDRWYVAQTQPRAESRAIIHLERQGYHVFCPRYRKTVRHARKAKSVLAPLFPNYLFLRLDAAHDAWRAVNSTRGVMRLISQGETPAPLPRGSVEDLLAKADAGGVMDWAPIFKIGQAVRIAEGPFADLVGKLEHLDAAGRVRVLLELLGRHVFVALRCDALMAAA
jgi:transcription elongation factor/antiterminator RfaH